jgi:hypothetical protein
MTMTREEILQELQWVFFTPEWRLISGPFPEMTAERMEWLVNTPVTELMAVEMTIAAKAAGYGPAEVGEFILSFIHSNDAALQSEKKLRRFNSEALRAADTRS